MSTLETLFTVKNPQGVGDKFEVKVTVNALNEDGANALLQAVQSGTELWQDPQLVVSPKVRELVGLDKSDLLTGKSTSYGRKK